MKKVIKAAETRTSGLLNEFLRYHEDDMNREFHPNSFKEMYEILDKYDDSNREDTVDVAFLKATPEDQQRMIDLIKFDPLPEEGTVDYCREMYYSALAGEWSETYKEDRAIVNVFENLFRAGLLNEEEFRTDL